MPKMHFKDIRHAIESQAMANYATWPSEGWLVLIYTIHNRSASGIMPTSPWWAPNRAKPIFPKRPFSGPLIFYSYMDERLELSEGGFFRYPVICPPTSVRLIKCPHYYLSALHLSCIFLSHLLFWIIIHEDFNNVKIGKIQLELIDVANTNFAPIFNI